MNKTSVAPTLDFAYTSDNKYYRQLKLPILVHVPILCIPGLGIYTFTYTRLPVRYNTNYKTNSPDNTCISSSHVLHSSILFYSAEYYVKVMKKIQEKGEEFVQTEDDRLGRMLS